MSCVVVDTNVYISAVVFGGTPARVLQLIDALGVELGSSAELEEEFSDTLGAKFGWPEERIAQARSGLWARARRVSPAPLSGVVRDADDDHVLACALASGARHIVTGDRDLLCLGEYQGVRIITPAAFLTRFGGAPE